jgi:hypothetical protein
VRDAIERITRDALRAVEAQPIDAVDPAAITLLLRRYRATGCGDCHDVAGRALGLALERPRESAEWLEAFAEAARLSDDERLRAAAAHTASVQRSRWAERGPLEQAARSVDACLGAAAAVDLPAVAADAIEELERLVSARYEPGAAMAPRSGPAVLADQACTASALLSAFSLTARLPYAMLAEELVQYSLQRLQPDLDRAGTGAAAGAFTAACLFARVLCRLGALHGDEDYRQAAVLAPDARYPDRARAILERLEPGCRGGTAVHFALAAHDYLLLDTRN